MGHNNLGNLSGAKWIAIHQSRFSCNNQDSKVQITDRGVVSMDLVGAFAPMIFWKPYICTLVHQTIRSKFVSVRGKQIE